MIYLLRHEDYCGRTTPIIEWRVIRVQPRYTGFKTKREAMQYIKDFYPLETVSNVSSWQAA